MDRIRISNGEKRIEVNDQGEYITLNFNDQSLLPRFSISKKTSKR